MDLGSGYIFYLIVSGTLFLGNLMIISRIPSYSFLKYWNLSLLFLLLLTLMAPLDNRFPTVVPFLVMVFGLTHAYFLYTAAAALNEQPGVPVIALISAGILIVLSIAKQLFIRESGGIRWMIFNLIILTACLGTVWLLVRGIRQARRQKRILSSYLFLLTALSLYALAWFMRIPLLIRTGSMSWNLLSGITLNRYTLLVFPNLTILLDVAFILLAVKIESARHLQINDAFIMNQSEQIFERFLARINHELNTPLGNSIMILDLVETSDEKGSEQALGILKRNLEIMEDIISDRSRVIEMRPKQLSGIFSQINRLLAHSFTESNLEYLYTGADADLGEIRGYLITIFNSLAELASRLLGYPVEKITLPVSGNLVQNRMALELRISPLWDRTSAAAILEQMLHSHTPFEETMDNQSWTWISRFTGLQNDGRLNGTIEENRMILKLQFRTDGDG